MLLCVRDSEEDVCRHRDTREVFMIFGSRVNDVDKEVSAAFLEEVRPFERARIWSGLRDLVAMDVFETSELFRLCVPLDLSWFARRVYRRGKDFARARREL